MASATGISFNSDKDSVLFSLAPVYIGQGKTSPSPQPIFAPFVLDTYAHTFSMQFNILSFSSPAEPHDLTFELHIITRAKVDTILVSYTFKNIPLNKSVQYDVYFSPTETIPIYSNYYVTVEFTGSIGTLVGTFIAGLSKESPSFQPVVR